MLQEGKIISLNPVLHSRVESAFQVSLSTVPSADSTPSPIKQIISPLPDPQSSFSSTPHIPRIDLLLLDLSGQWQKQELEREEQFEFW
jgi:hypothetical protein